MSLSHCYSCLYFFSHFIILFSIYNTSQILGFLRFPLALFQLKFCLRSFKLLVLGSFYTFTFLSYSLQPLLTFLNILLSIIFREKNHIICKSDTFYFSPLTEIFNLSLKRLFTILSSIC